MSETITSSSGSSGVVHIADEVIASIARTAALETEGVASMVSHFTGDIAGKISRKKPARGVALQVTDENVKITVQIMVRSGSTIQTVAKDVQQKIKSAIETMTNYTASEVNVFVSGLVA